MELKLAIDLVPKTCSTKNVRVHMGKPAWKKLRDAVLAYQGSACRICGSSRAPECHEAWEFDAKGYIQRLTAFQIVCKMCHLVIHINQAETLMQTGYPDIVKVVRKHFLKVNRVKGKIFDEHLASARQIHKVRSKHEWTMDLGRYGKTDEYGRIVRIDLGIDSFPFMWEWVYSKRPTKAALDAVR